jgi:hypothetical protein
MGDLNDKVGSSNDGKETTMGSDGLEDRNNIGEMLSILCQENNHVIGGTLFMQKTYVKRHGIHMIARQGTRSTVS